MDLNQLKSFVAVAHQGNLTQAAETLHLSQPAVSAQIKAIEKNLDVVLFERNAQGMALTRSGEAFLPQAEAMLQHMHKLDQFAASLSTTYVSELQLGLIHPMPGEHVAQLTQAILAAHPTVQLQYRYDLSGNIINAVRKKELHGGFFLGHNPYRNVCSLFLENIEYVLVCPQPWLPELTENFPKNLNHKPWIAMSELSGSHKQIRQLWRELRLNPPQSVVCDQQQALIDLVAAHIGLSLVPRNDAELALAQNKKVAILNQATQWIPLSFIYAKEHELDPMVAIAKQGIQHTWPKSTDAG
ncbi:LysR family transcriptional regulator [Snodgrassella sp. CFCC 13594]|uniref:LysR family transcriptional regulator n=1 Tax=Snodgrassella sp. CFCC 13594 TaxID=1775559 RepID=UPI00082A8C88|nr:LysR family transcriptional regulator [Snodgrassella sp. CFCC 13594]